MPGVSETSTCKLFATGWQADAVIACIQN